VEQEEGDVPFFDIAFTEDQMRCWVTAVTGNLPTQICIRPTPPHVIIQHKRKVLCTFTKGT